MSESTALNIIVMGHWWGSGRF